MASWTREDHDGVAVLTFRREPSNWMDLVSMGELADHLATLAEQTDAVRVVMLTGGLDGYFIAHADLDDLAKLAKGEPIEGDLTSWYRSLHLLESMPQPTVAAIDGQAWGGGCETSSPARCASAPSGPTSASRRSPSGSSRAPGAPSGSRASSGARSGLSSASRAASWAPRRRSGSAC